MQMHYRPSVTSRWLEIGQFLFCFVMDHYQEEVKVDKKRKKRTMPLSSHLDRSILVNKGFII